MNVPARVETPTIAKAIEELEQLVRERDLLADLALMLLNERAENNRKKLSKKEADEIRRLHRTGVSQTELADIYDVNRATVSRIVRNIYHS